jgi:hypothetical protein
METKHSKFIQHPLKYILIPLIVIMSIISYYRFMVRQDYLVRYEGTCDATIQKCFIGCEDDACTKESNYSKVVKYAPDIYKECGEDITDCEAANTCLPNDRNCSVTYCDPKIDDECTTPVVETNISNNDSNLPESGLLQNNETQI